LKQVKIVQENILFLHKIFKKKFWGGHSPSSDLNPTYPVTLPHPILNFWIRFWFWPTYRPLNTRWSLLHTWQYQQADTYL